MKPRYLDQRLQRRGVPTTGDDEEPHVPRNGSGDWLGYDGGNMRCVLWPQHHPKAGRYHVLQLH